MKELLDLVDQTGTTDSIAVEIDGERTPVILLHTTGVKSGAERRTPVIRIERDGVYAVVASAGGADTNPSWYHNVKANPDVVVQDRTEISRFTAREVTDDERARWWDEAVSTFPPYADYASQTTRAIPVLVLEPRG